MSNNFATFEDNLAFGRIAESKITRWILDRENTVIPIYTMENEEDYKGPRVLLKDEQIVSPDLLVINKDSSVCWIEAKHKTVFSWHRRTKRWVTGIDAHHYSQYRRVMEIVDWPVWLLFLHISSEHNILDFLIRKVNQILRQVIHSFFELL